MLLSRSTLRRCIRFSSAISSSDPVAAVSLIEFVNHLDSEILVLKRVERAGDSWSGQLAFPGQEEMDLSASDFINESNRWPQVPSR